MRPIKTPSVLILLCATLLAAGCMVHPLTLEREFNVVSESKELDIGRGAHPQIVQQFGYYYNQRLQNYVESVGKKLVHVCRRQDIEYHFTVLDTEMENAFALPGGYVYITRGLLALINSEAELACVLGHEIGHVAARDSAALMSRNMVAQIVTLAGVAGAAASPSASSGDLAIATNQLFSTLMLGFSREREYFADEQSVEYMVAAGYDPQQALSFMRSLSYKSQGLTGVQQYLMTHPYIFDRMARIESKIKVINTMKDTMGKLQETKTVQKSSRKVAAEKYKSYLDGLPYGPKDNLRHIKIYTVRSGDSLPVIARRTLGSAVKAKQLAEINGIPVNTQLIPGAKIKTIF